MIHFHSPDAGFFDVTVRACFYLRRVDILARIVTFTVPDFSADLRRCPGVAALGSLRKSFFFFLSLTWQPVHLTHFSVSWLRQNNHQDELSRVWCWGKFYRHLCSPISL